MLVAYECVVVTNRYRGTGTQQSAHLSLPVQPALLFVQLAHTLLEDRILVLANLLHRVCVQRATDTT